VTRIARVVYNHVLDIGKKVGVRNIKISTRKKDFGEGRLHHAHKVSIHLMIPFCPLKTVVGAYPPLTWLVFCGPQSWSCHPS
jgi:hypothetical protein